MLKEKQNSHWGWIVVISASIIRIAVYGVTYTSGIVANIALDVFHRSKFETSWIASIITAAVYLTCPVSSPFVERYSSRRVAFIGGIVAGIGLIGSSFSVNLAMMCTFYGVITGIGLGLTFIPASVAVATYFTERRNLALGLASAGGGIGTFAFPPIIKLLKNSYGWQGMFLILAGICFNICVFALFYRPVITPKAKESAITSSLSMTSRKEAKSNAVFIITNPKLVIFSINSFLFGFGSSVIYGHLDIFANKILVLDEYIAAMSYSVIGISVLIWKLLHGVFATFNYRLCQPVIIYNFFYLIGGLSTFVLLTKTDAIGLMFYSAAFGASYAACGGCLMPAIIIEIGGVERLAFIYGIVLALNAIGALFGPPAAGFLFDLQQSYDAAFTLAAVTITASALIMFPHCKDVFFKPEATDVTIMVNDEKPEKMDVENRLLSRVKQVDEDNNFQYRNGHLPSLENGNRSLMAVENPAVYRSVQHLAPGQSGSRNVLTFLDQSVASITKVLPPEDSVEEETFRPRAGTIH